MATQPRIDITGYSVLLLNCDGTWLCVQVGKWVDTVWLDRVEIAHQTPKLITFRHETVLPRKESSAYHPCHQKTHLEGRR